MKWLLFYFFIFFLSYSLTGMLRHYLLNSNVVDVPNHRSSHIIPTPRGGGLAFVLSFLLGLLVLFYLKFITYTLLIVLISSGSSIAFIGYLDDQVGLSARWRLLSHFAISCMALFLLGGMPAISFSTITISTGLILNFLAVFYLVWLLNLYNFMDGINGIAAIEAITISLGGSLLFFIHNDYYAMLALLLLAITTSGFLFWNFPTAFIFMGDVGSGFLGLILGVFSIYATKMNASFFWSWLVLLGVFIVDATFTLCRRAIDRENLAVAHCSHAYQHAARYYGKHYPVTLSVILINLLWLLPIALLIGFNLINNILGLIIAYLPLLVIAFKLNAGKN